MQKHIFALTLLLVAAGMPARAWQSHTTATLPPGLVAWWPGDGNATDVAGKNASKIVGGVTFAPGVVGRSFQFDGKTGGIVIPDADALKITGSLTISAWVKLASYPTADRSGAQIVFRGDDRAGLDPYSLAVHHDGLLFFAVDSGSGYADVSAPILVGTFVHVAATLDNFSGRQRLFLDGHVIAERVTSVRPFRDLDAQSNPGVGIGNTQNPAHNGQPFRGIIDEVRLYSRVLPPSEIQTLAKLPAPDRSAAASRSRRPGSNGSTAVPRSAGLAKKPPTKRRPRERHGGALSQAEIDRMLGVNVKSEEASVGTRERTFREELARNEGRTPGEIRDTEAREAARRATAAARQTDALRASVRVASVDQQGPILLGRRSWFVILAFDNLASEIAPPFVQLKFDDASSVHLMLYDGYIDEVIPNVVGDPTNFRIPPGRNQAAAYYADDTSLNDTKKPAKVILWGPGVGTGKIEFPIPK